MQWNVLEGWSHNRPRMSLWMENAALDAARRSYLRVQPSRGPTVRLGGLSRARRLVATRVALMVLALRSFVNLNFVCYYEPLLAYTLQVSCGRPSVGR